MRSRNMYEFLDVKEVAKHVHLNSRLQGSHEYVSTIEVVIVVSWEGEEVFVVVRNRTIDTVRFVLVCLSCRAGRSGWESRLGCPTYTST
jgi:hypothetical protein